MTDMLETEADLRGIYPQPGAGAVQKQLAIIDPHSRRFIELSPFLCIGTSRPDGLADVSPRGGEPGFVHVLDDTHLAMPDRPGNIQSRMMRSGLCCSTRFRPIVPSNA